MKLLSDRFANLGTESAFKIGTHIRDVELAGHRVIRCNLGEPDFPLPEYIREELKRQIDKDNAHYCDPQGIPPLRDAVARHVSRTRGIPVTPERVVVFPGGKPPIGLCQEAYTNPGDEILFPSPGFPIYESFIGYVGAKHVPLHLSEEKGFAVEAARLEALITPRTKLIYLNFPSNPTGGVATREQLAELAEVIRRKAPENVRVYSDEIYEDILFDGARHHSIASVPGMEKNTIIASGASKSFSWTGGRIGWAVFPTDEEAQVFKTLNINYFSCVPPYNQEGAREALESPRRAAAIATMVKAFQERRDLVVPELNKVEGIRCQNPRGAFYVFPNIGGVCEALGAVRAYEAFPADLKAKTSPSTLFQLFLLYSYQVATMDRKSFGRIGSEGKHYLRISIATGMADLQEALRRIALAAEDADGFARYLREGKLYF